MKTTKSIIITIIFCFAFIISVDSVAQTASKSFDNRAAQKIEKGNIFGAQKGSLICQDENGNRVVCSGSLTETILGIATNVPYVTINKPQNPQGSKFIFEGIVSIENGEIKANDALTAGKSGMLRKCNENEIVYAVALENVEVDNQRIKVKVIQK